TVRYVRARPAMKTEAGELWARRSSAGSKVDAGSAAQLEPVDQLLVATGMLDLQIFEQAPALADHHQQAAAGMEILAVGGEMLGEILDPLGEDRDLYFRRPGVALFGRIVFDERSLALGRNRHRQLLCSRG